MKLILIDAYALIYRAYYAFLKNPISNSKGQNISAIYGFVNSLDEVIRKEKPTHIAVGFDPAGPTFRHLEYENYKAQREESPEVIRESVPVIKDIIRAYNIPIIEKEGFEADDVICTVAVMAEKKGFDVYLFTPDKDYAQVVSEHIFLYRPKFGGGYETLGINDILQKYSITSAGQIKDMLGLMGDSSDNIPGCPGIGEKTAIKLLTEYGSVENLLENADKLKGATKTRITENAEQIKMSKYLATIITDVPVDFNEDEFAVRPTDKNKLIEIYSDLEIRAFIKKIKAEEGEKQVRKPEKQGSLFAEFEDVPPVEVEYPIVEGVKSIEHSYYIANNEEDIKKLVEIISSHKIVCFDTETESVEPLKAKLVGMSFAVRAHEAWYVPIPEDMTEACKILEHISPTLSDASIMKVGQNIKFDILVLRKYGIKVAGPLFDTMIAHYVLNPEQRHGMDYLAEVYLKYKTIHIDELIGPRGKNQGTMRNVPLDIIAEYAAEDADITLQLKNIFEKELREQNLERLFYDMESPLVYVLADMEESGVKLDVNALKQTSIHLTESLANIEEEIYAHAGSRFNINSSKQAGEILFEKLKLDDKAKKTKTGLYSTSEETLEKLRNKHPIVDQLLVYRGIKKLLSTYIDALPSLIYHGTNKIHTSFNQTVTSTGRLSSANPNLQNIPIREEMGREIRKAFIPDNSDCLFFSADYSQIELRIMAHLSKDSNMIAAFNNNEDIHSATAAKIYNIPLEEVSRDMRRKAKTANFGIIYGISAFGLSERLNISRGEAKELIDGYFTTFPGIKNYIESSIMQAREKGYVETIFNRKRMLPDINSGNATVRGYAERNAINAPIQGSSADIIKIAMINIHKRFNNAGLRSQMILQVHDELNFNVYSEELVEVRKTVIEEMENVIKLDVPLVVECGVGVNWLEAH
ncbi:MAG: DNA polymerase I [Tannerellaceae bacterium]|jgi:DNA polymerase-1|nr:DNA polymerase I [Tannerellaceae bacterium]